MDETRIPFIVYGDGPRVPSGLARIARDLTARLWAEQEELGIRLAQVGVDWPGGWHWQAWDFCGFQPTPSDQGRGAVAMVVEDLRKETGARPIVLMIMDPARCYDLTRKVGNPGEVDLEPEIDAEFWGYFPIDSHNQNGAIGGPAARAVADCQRVLAYGRYGADILKRTQAMVYAARPGAVAPPIQYLPHGLEPHVFHPGVPLDRASEAFQAWARAVPPNALRIGAVATNQPRKDLGLLFTTVAQLRSQGYPVAVWLHTDKLTHAWDVGELAATCALRREEVAISIEEERDEQLAARYAWSDVTIAPGLGEGFGYPIVESLACGTPVVHGKYAGGVELVPYPGWLVDPVAWRLESLYALQRPVFHPKDMADAVLRAYSAAQQDPPGMAQYCSGSVAHLSWQHLWPRWRKWIQTGLIERRKARSEERHGARGTRESEPVQAVEADSPAK